MFYSLQKQRKHSEERSFGRFKISLKCYWMFTLVSSKCNPLKSGWSLNLIPGHIGKSIRPKGFESKYKADVLDFISVYENGGQSDYRKIPQATTRLMVLILWNTIPQKAL